MFKAYLLIWRPNAFSDGVSSESNSDSEELLENPNRPTVTYSETESEDSSEEEETEEESYDQNDD